MFIWWCKCRDLTVPILLVLVLFTTSLRAQIDGFNPFVSPEENQEFQAGKELIIAWEPTPKFGERISIRLLSGDSETTMDLGLTIASKIKATVGKFPWTIPTDLVQEKTYGLRIALDSDPLVYQYSYPFGIKFANSPPGPSSSSKPVASTSTSSTTVIATLSDPTTTSNNVPTKTSASSSVVTQSTASGANTQVAQTSSTGILLVSPTSSLPPSIIPSSTDQSSAPTSAPQPGTPGSSNSKTGLGAGIGVGVGIVAVLALLVWFFLRRRKRKGSGEGYIDVEGKSNPKSPKDDGIELAVAPQALSDEEKERRKRAIEMEGGHVDRRQELEGDKGVRRLELEGDRKRRSDVYEMG